MKERYTEKERESKIKGERKGEREGRERGERGRVIWFEGLAGNKR